VRDAVAFIDFTEVIDDVLGTSDAEGRDDEPGASGVDIFNERLEFILNVGLGGMEPVAVGAFGDEPVHVVRGRRWGRGG